MVTTLAVTKAIKTIRDAHERFGLSRSEEPAFFTEWQQPLPLLSSLEDSELSRLKNRYLYYLELGEISEGTVNFIMISPLLNALGLCDPPYRICGEHWVRLALDVDTEEGISTLEGRIDALTLQDRFWMVVVEGKRGGFNVLQAVPQALAYMMANPHSDRPTFGLVTNGYDLLFLKLVRGKTNQYALSHNFTLLSDRDNNLLRVGQVIKRLVDLG